MRSTAIKLFPPIQLTVSAAALYTVPTGSRTVIKKLTFTNSTASVVSVNVNLVPSGGTPDNTNILVSARAVAPGECYECYEAEGHTLGAGDKLEASATTGAAVTAQASGIELGMIRRATIEDFDAMCAMGRKFHEASGANRFSAFDDESFKDTLADIIHHDNAMALVMEKAGIIYGMTAVVNIPLYYNTHHIAANELFCWVEPEYRAHGMKLFDAIEQWAVESGAHSTVIARIPGLRDEALHRIYTAKGFVETDCFYTKVLHA